MDTDSAHRAVVVKAKIFRGFVDTSRLSIGLVEREPNGRHVHYRLRTATAERLMHVCDELIEEVGTRIEACTNYERA